MSISPHADWNGTEGTGFSDNGGGGVAIPVDPTRTTYKPVAHFTTPPIRYRVTTTFEIGVLAFAKGGIDSVTFYCEGTTETITSQTLADDGIPEYLCTVDLTSEDTDGKILIYAEVNPTSPTAQKRVLGPYEIYGNANGTLSNTGTEYWVDPVSGDDATGDGTEGNPKQTVAGLYGLETDWSGVTVYLEAGTHSGLTMLAESANSGPITFTRSASTTSKSDVVIRGNGGTSNRHRPKDTIVKDVTIEQFDRVFYNELTGGQYLYEDCLFQGDLVTTGALHFGGKLSFLNCHADQWRSSVPYQTNEYVRNSTANSCSGDIVSRCPVALGVTVTNHQQLSGEHADLFQVEASDSYENHLIYGVSSVGQAGQGIFITKTASGTALRDAAFVNCLIDSNGQNTANWPVDHMLLYHTSFTGAEMSFVLDLSMQYQPISSLVGEFNANAGGIGATSGVTFHIPKNLGNLTNGTHIYLSDASGTLTVGETITEVGGDADGSATVESGSYFISKNGYNEIRNCYFLDLQSNAQSFVTEDWTIADNGYDNTATWKAGTGVVLADDPFVDSVGLDFTPLGMPTVARLDQVLWDINGNLRTETTSTGAEQESTPITPPSPRSYPSPAAALLL